MEISERAIGRFAQIAGMIMANQQVLALIMTSERGDREFGKLHRMVFRGRTACLSDSSLGSFIQQIIADEKGGTKHAVGLIGRILNIHNHRNRTLDVPAFGADFSRLGNAGGLLELAMDFN
jgi:hypothetical protein